MKAVSIILVLVLGYLFYPFYDLYTRDDVFEENYSLVHKGYWTRGKCAAAAEAQAAEVYYCRKRNLWSTLFKTYTQYDPGIREIRQESRKTGQFQ